MQLTFAELRRWEDNNATWRVLEAHEERVVLALCTCTGEPVDVVEAADDLGPLIRSGEIQPAT